jgi:hypothetical protein
MFGDICFCNNWVIGHGHPIFIESEFERQMLN